MGIKIIPASSDDGLAVAILNEAAHANDIMHQSGFPASITDAQRQEYLNWRALRFRNSHAEPNMHIFKAVDEDSDRLVGITAFASPSQAQAGERYAGRPEWMIDMDARGALFAEMRKDVIGDREGEFWYLRAMAVHPDFQRRGIASQLLRTGLGLVDQAGMDCYLESTENAVKVYSKHGFVLKQTAEVLDGRYTLSAMVRPGKAKSKH